MIDVVAVEAVIDFLQVELGPFLQRPQSLVLILPKFGRSHCSDDVRDGDKKFILQVVGIDAPHNVAHIEVRYGRVYEIVNRLVLFGTP